MSQITQERPDIEAPSLADLGVDTTRPLLLVDVDEVLCLFIKGFIDFLHEAGLEMRLQRFALLQNIYRPGAVDPVELKEAVDQYHRFYREHCGELELVPGAFAALKALSRRNSIVILTNAPADALDLRTQWLRKNGLHYPLVVNEGLKGPIAAKLVAQTETRSAFVDDLLMHLDSVAEHSPRTATFQHVADERLRAIAPSSERHVRIDDWPRLAAVIEETLQA